MMQLKNFNFRSRTLLPWFVFLGSLTFLIWLFIVFDLSRIYQRSLSHSQSQTRSLARIYAEEVTSSIAMADYVLLDLRDQWKNNPVEYGAIVQTRQVHLDPRIAFYVSIVDSKGRIIFSSTGQPADRAVDVSDRQHFRFHQLNSIDKLYISEPILGRVTNRWMILFTRPLRTASGQFDGVVTLAVSPEYFSRFHKSIDLGAGGAISLVREDGKMLARFPNPELALGNRVSNLRFLEPNAPVSGSFQKISKVDQVNRWYSWQILEVGNLVAVVGQTSETIFEEYYRLRTIYIWSGLAATLLFILIGLFMLNYVRRQEKSAAAIEAMEKALQRSQKLESIGQLTGGVAHDFNNILQIIGGNIQMLEMLCSGNKQAEIRLKSTLDAVDRGARLSAQLLTFARRQSLRSSVINLAHRIESIYDLIQRLVGSAIEINMRSAEDLWNTRIDPDLFENVILNLAANARDAMDGKGSLKFELSNIVVESSKDNKPNRMTEGEYILLEVSDTGCGMPPEVAEHVFDPFFTTKPEGEGTGLGLSMAYGFVKQSGGYIYIMSMPGAGTTVQIFLPRTLEKAADLPASAQKVPDGGNETILLVEDDPEVELAVGSLLTGLGYRVLNARNAAQAIEIMESDQSVDVLLTDVVMPGTMNGAELAKYARKTYPSLPIVLASGYAYDAIKGADTLEENLVTLKKPYLRDQLDQAIQQALAQGSGKN